MMRNLVNNSIERNNFGILLIMFLNYLIQQLLFIFAAVYYTLLYMAGIYVHIPFCKKRCIYCDFYSTVCMEKQQPYIEALTNELKLRADYLRLNGLFPSIETIYIGGGTPSTLDTSSLEDIFDSIYRTYPVSEQAEITIECNPDDLSTEKIQELHHLPINRLSIGIQTFSDNHLRFLNRRHNGQQAISAVKECQDLGFDNISIDLIYGLPTQDHQNWEDNLKIATNLNVQHISAYSLIYEEGTRLFNMRQQGMAEEAPDQVSLRMFNTLIDQLSDAGFEHYEISNFARKGYRSRHNSSYWKGIPYIGCGPSAHSYDGTNRQWNISDINCYIDNVVRCTSPSDFTDASWIEKEVLTTTERYNDRIITALRTSDGLNLSLLRQDFGNRLADYCLKVADKHLRNGVLEIVEKNEQNPQGLLRLTRQGIFLSDGIMSDLLFIED